jgi:hypothetical protein
MGHQFRRPNSQKAQVRLGAACRNRTDDLFITSQPTPRPLTSAQVRKPLVTGPTRTSADTGGQPATETRSETTTTIAAPRLHPHADEPGGRSSADGYE